MEEQIIKKEIDLSEINEKLDSIISYLENINEK